MPYTEPKTVKKVKFIDDEEIKRGRTTREIELGYEKKCCVIL